MGQTHRRDDKPTLTDLKASISCVRLSKSLCSFPTSDTSLIIVSLLAFVSSSVLFRVSFKVRILPFSIEFSFVRSVSCSRKIEYLSMYPVLENFHVAKFLRFGQKIMSICFHGFPFLQMAISKKIKIHFVL